MNLIIECKFTLFTRLEILLCPLPFVSVKRRKKTVENVVKMLWSQLMSLCGDTAVDNLDDLKQLAEILITNHLNGRIFCPVLVLFHPLVDLQYC